MSQKKGRSKRQKQQKKSLGMPGIEDINKFLIFIASICGSFMVIGIIGFFLVERQSESALIFGVIIAVNAIVVLTAFFIPRLLKHMTDKEDD